MIIQEKNNCPAAAPEIHDIAGLLPAYRTYSQNPGATLPKLVEFLTTPSFERDEFLSSMPSENYVVNNRYSKTIILES